MNRVSGPMNRVSGPMNRVSGPMNRLPEPTRRVLLRPRVRLCRGRSYKMRVGGHAGPSGTIKRGRQPATLTGHRSPTAVGAGSRSSPSEICFSKATLPLSAGSAASPVKSSGLSSMRSRTFVSSVPNCDSAAIAYSCSTVSSSGMNTASPTCATSSLFLRRSAGIK